MVCARWTAADEDAVHSRFDHPTDHPTALDYPTALGASTPTTITLLGQDLAADVMGEVGFGELAFWLAARRRPTRRPRAP